MRKAWDIKTKFATVVGLQKLIQETKFKTGLAKCTDYLALIELVIDNEATRDQEVYLKRHMKICLKCLDHYNLDQELKKALQLKLTSKQVPERLADAIRMKIANSATYMQKGKAIIFSAPSGSGKTTIVKHILSQFPEIEFSISASTRDKRGREETNGKDYHFLDPDEFKDKIDKDEFVEWEEVYEGNFYGTLKSEIKRIWDKGHHVIFDVDVKGGINLKNYFGEDALSVFVRVKDIDVLTSRLKDRGTESEASLSRRLYKAKFEMSFENKFDTSLINDELEESYKNAEKMISEFIAK